MCKHGENSENKYQMLAMVFCKKFTGDFCSL